MELEEFAKQQSKPQTRCVLCNSGHRPAARKAYYPNEEGVRVANAPVISRWLKEVHGIVVGDSAIQRCLKNHD